MPGGKIAPDGRPAQVPGVGKTARRHDLEAPATPGLHDSDLQQGDVSKLENAQRVAPTPKRTQPSAGPSQGARRQGVKRGSGDFAMEVPDPIQMAAGRPDAGTGGAVRMADPTAWVPLLRMIARVPNAGGGITAGLLDMLSQYHRRPIVSQGNLIDLNELDRQIAGG